MKITQTTLQADVFEPVTFAELREHLRIEHDEDDAYLIALVSAARQAAEQHIDGIIADREFTYSIDAFAPSIELPLYPVDPASIEIEYTNTAGATQAHATFDYEQRGQTLHIRPDPGAAWPSTQNVKDAVRISFSAGFAGAHGAIPQNVKHAILMIASTLYDQRRDVTAQTMNLVPMSSQYLLEPYRRTVL